MIKTQRMKPSVCIVIFGTESAKNISIICNELGIHHEAVYPDVEPNERYTHVILSGGPKHVYEADAYIIPEWVIKSEVPVLGICYGMQAISKYFGGIVCAMNMIQKGPVMVTEIRDNNLISARRWMSRLDRVIVCPPNFHVIGVTPANHVAVITDNKRWYGVQYHPEHPEYPDIELFTRFLSI